jgi:glyoxylase-like metal-dependent hydrolase (beta-lactamase superfamily II)
VSGLEHPAYAAARAVTPFASVLLAENPSPMTLDGTNTWLVGAPGSVDHVVIDPGPDDEDHLRRVAEQGPVSLILLTHHHPDHAAGVAAFAEWTDAPVRALDPALCAGAPALGDCEVITASGVELTVLATPGHTADSVCFGLGGDVPAVFTGDSILGRGTTIVAHPDGHLGAYLHSLRFLAETPSPTLVLPGHGPELPDLRAAASAYLAHREQRLDQVRGVVHDQGAEVDARTVVEIVYADVDRAVWPAAEATVRAQLTYLRERGER